jgi:hypothetical protein
VKTRRLIASRESPKKLELFQSLIYRDVSLASAGKLKDLTFKVAFSLPNLELA